MRRQLADIGRGDLLLGMATADNEWSTSSQFDGLFAAFSILRATVSPTTFCPRAQRFTRFA
jgi:hypothetical protein